MKYGPVDLVIVAATEPKLEGRILDALEGAVAAGSIRVLDAMLLAMDADGRKHGLDIEELGADIKQRLGFIETGTTGLFDSSDADTLYEGMVPGSVVLALAIENAWAVPVMNALGEAGMEIAMHTRVPAVVVNEALGVLAAEE